MLRRIIAMLPLFIAGCSSIPPNPDSMPDRFTLQSICIVAPQPKDLASTQTFFDSDDALIELPRLVLREGMLSKFDNFPACTGKPWPPADFLRIEAELQTSAEHITLLNLAVEHLRCHGLKEYPVREYSSAGSEAKPQLIAMMPAFGHCRREVPQLELQPGQWVVLGEYPINRFTAYLLIRVNPPASSAFRVNGDEPLLVRLPPEPDIPVAH